MPRSRELVVDAAFAVLRRYPETRQLPTVQSVREYLGKGSPNTINEEIKVFWERLAGRITLPMIPEGLQEAAAVFWERAAQEGQAAFERHRAVVNAELNEARTAQRNAEDLAQRLAVDLSSARDEITQLNQRLSDKQAECAMLTRDLDAEALGRKHAEAQLADLRERLAVQTREHRGALSAVNENAAWELETLKAEHGKTLQLERERFDAMEERYGKQLEGLQAARLSLENELKRRTDERDVARGETMHFKARIEAVESERERAAQQNKRLQEELTEAKMQAAELTERLSAIGREYERKVVEYQQLSQAFDITQGKTQKQAETINSLRERLVGLDSEKRLLARELKALQRRKGGVL
ncbi:MAG: DNA-binding protein [Gammaproteobacteria bacterium]